MNAISPSIAANDERFHELLAEYLRRTDHGEQVDQAAFMAAHPDYAEALAEYFDGASVVEQMAGPKIGEQNSHATAHGQLDVETSASFQRDVTRVKAPDKTCEGSPRSDPKRAISDEFGRYQILKELGQGAMGAVYLALDTQLQRQVALKIPKFSGVEAADMLERFYREARAAATLRHPNICPVYDVGAIDDQHYITMAFIEGRPLKDFTHSRKRQSEKQVAVVIRKLALGLAEAHAHGIIHRDLKPANIMVDKKGEPVVMDFGLARRDEGSDRHMTRSGAILGTPAYMSPEQVEGDQSKIGPPADVYSLGVVMYELLTGKVPFNGSLMSILMQIASEQPKPPSLHRPGLDPRLETICLKMMAKKANERYVSMIDVAKALSEYLKTPAVESAATGNAATDSGGDGLGSDPGNRKFQDSASMPAASALKERPLPVARRLEETPATPAEMPTSFTVVPGHLSNPPRPPAATPMVDSSNFERGQGEDASEGFRSSAGNAFPGTPGRASLANQLHQRAQRFSPKVWVALGSGLAGVIVLLAAVTIFLRVGHVDLKVVIDDPSLAVKIEGETITFEGSGKSIRVKPGPRKFVVEHNGVEAETDKFVVKDKGKNVLEVSLVDGTVVVVKDGRLPLSKREPETNPVEPSPPPTIPTVPVVLKLSLLASLPSEFVFTTAVSHDGKLIAGGNAGVTRIWNAADGATLVDVKLEAKTTPFTLAFTPDGRHLAWGGWGNEEIRLYDVKTGEPVRTMRGNTGMVRSLCFSADGKRLLSGSQGRRFGQGYQFSHGPNSRVWNVDTGEELKKFAEDSVSVGGCWLADGRRAVSRTGTGSLVRRWDTETGKEELVYGRDLPDVGTVTLSSHQKYVAASLKNNVVLVWETDSGKQVQRLEPAGHPAFTPDGERLLCSSSQGASLRLFDVRTGAEVARVEEKLPDGVGFIHMFPKGDRALVSTYSSGHAYVVSLTATGKGTQSSSATSAFGLPPFVPKSTTYVWPKDAPPPAIAPFDAKQAQANQQAWAEYLKVPIEITNSIGMKLRLIPPGEFLMGSTPQEIESALLVAGGDEQWKAFIRSEGPRHQVILTQPIYLGAHEVTQDQYTQVMGTNPSHFAATGIGKDAIAGFDTRTFPVEMVNWNDTTDFCVKLSEKEQLEPCYVRNGEARAPRKGSGYRLPTEAEWEFACRAGTTTRYWTGDQDESLLQACWFGPNSGDRNHTVGELQANPFGLFDVHGNVWEWVQDWWDPNYYGQFVDKPAIDPNGPASAGTERAARSCNWRGLAAGCRAAGRGAPRFGGPTSRTKGMGFRVAVSVAAAKGAMLRPSAARSDPSQAVDLLKLVDVNRDAVKGKWTLTANGLASDGGVLSCRLKFPYKPPAEYDFRVEFTAQDGNDILQLLSASGKDFTWLMGAWGGQYDGFDTVKGHPLARDGKGIVGGPSLIRRGQRHTSVIEVRKDSITARIDGKLVARHETDGADLGMPREWSIGEGAIGLGTTFNAVVFHKVEIEMPAARTKDAASQAVPKNAPPPAVAPFDAKQAVAHQEAWAGHLGVPVEWENSVGMKFRLIPPGEFLMGNARQTQNEGPQHRVGITKGFYLAIHETTQGAWKAVMKTEPWNGPVPDDGMRNGTKLWQVKEGPNFAAHYLSWNDGREFCKTLGEKEGRAYRLPTEAEWEYACRAGSTTLFSFGDDERQLGDHAWYGGLVGNGNAVNERYVHEVGKKLPNPFGLFDIHGNVMEWCQDEYDAQEYGRRAGPITTDPQGPSGAGALRVHRGGGWNDVGMGGWSQSRRRNPAGFRGHDLGFRVVVSVDSVKERSP